MTMTREERDEFEMDGFRTEAASQFGFETTNDDANEYKCTEAHLLNFAKACERKGMADARAITVDVKDNRRVAHFVHDFQAGFKHGAFVVENRLNEHIAELDAYLKPIVETERQRYLTASGYVPIDPAKPEGGWVAPHSAHASIPRAPDGWRYELANARWPNGDWDNWTVHISMIRPNVPPGSIRNLRPLFAGEAESV